MVLADGGTQGGPKRLHDLEQQRSETRREDLRQGNGEPSGGVGANQTAEHDGGLNVSGLRLDILQVQVRKQEEQQEGGEGIKPHHREKPGEEEASKIGMLTRIDPEPAKES